MSEHEAPNAKKDAHIAEAQRLLALANSCDWTTPHEAYRDVAIAAAQVHATLAVALSTPPEGDQR